MNDRERLGRLQSDLQRATTVIYLEGKSDPAVFFATLGVARPRSDIHQDIYVVGLGGKASGGTEIRALVRVASEHGLAKAPGAGRILGVIDGDGRGLSALNAEFQAPFAGPLFSWPTYCVENLLARAAWPATWGEPPNWHAVLTSYVPYAALNRVHREIQRGLETLGLHRFRSPEQGRPLETIETVEAALAQDKHLIANRDVSAEFQAAVASVRGEIDTSIEHGHAQINGKWLCRHFARVRTGNSEEQCVSEWADAVRAAGGLHAVRDWWQRITGTAP